MDNILTKIRVAIADDHQIFRKGVILSLRQYQEFQFVFEANNGKELIELIPIHKPDIVLCDLKMPVMDGIAAMKHIARNHPEIRVLILTMYEDPKFIGHLMDCGASAYLLKHTEPAEISRAIHAVVKEKYYITPIVYRVLSKKHVPERLAEAEAEFDISEREKLILDLMYKKNSDKEISDRLDLSPRTILAIKERLMERFGVDSLLGLMTFALEHNLIEIKKEDMTQDSNNQFSISEEQKLLLFSHSTSIMKYINHDLRNQASRIKAIFLLLSDQLETLEKVNNEMLDISAIKQLINEGEETAWSINAISNVIKSNYHFQSSDKKADFETLFVAKPFDIIQTLKERYKSVKIKLQRDEYKNLEIIYPPNVLLYIFAELIENALKAKKTELTMTFKWRMKDNVFQCEVHDNGIGFPLSKTTKFASIDQLEIKSNSQHGGRGLNLINRSIIDSYGRLFFSHSKLLKGAFVYFEFPVIDFKYKKS